MKSTNSSTCLFVQVDRHNATTCRKCIEAHASDLTKCSATEKEEFCEHKPPGPPTPGVFERCTFSFLAHYGAALYTEAGQRETWCLLKTSQTFWPKLQRSFNVCVTFVTFGAEMKCKEELVKECEADRRNATKCKAST